MGKIKDKKLKDESMFEVKRTLPVRGLNYNVDSNYHGHFNYGPFIELKAEINNAYDNYAVAVYYGEWNEKIKVGYLPKEENEFYHHYLSEGGDCIARVSHLNKESSNHSLDYLFIEITLQLKKQKEFDLFLKFNKINESENLNIQRWIRKPRYSRPTLQEGQQGFLLDPITNYQVRGGPDHTTGQFLPKENIVGWRHIRGKGEVPYGETITVSLVETKKGKYRLTENADGSITKIGGDYEYEILWTY